MRNIDMDWYDISVAITLRAGISDGKGAAAALLFSFSSAVWDTALSWEDLYWLWIFLKVPVLPFISVDNQNLIVKYA